MDRRDFLNRAAIGAAAAIASPSLLFSQQQPKKSEKPPALSPDQVRDFVAAGHSDLEKVKSMLADSPNLLFACWDWGGGDFETALEGAGHMGRADIAEFLISQGARPNIFVLTMLGNTRAVKAQLEQHPQILNAKGPHGLSLLHHAEVGGEAAAELATYVKYKGLTVKKFDIYS